MGDVLTLHEAAGHLKLPLDTTECEAAQGGIPVRRIDRTRRYQRPASVIPR